MKKLMAERHPIYAGADITIESREAPHEVMVGNILDALASQLAQETPRGIEDRLEQQPETD
jgi:shikimate kinase